MRRVDIWRVICAVLALVLLGTEVAAQQTIAPRRLFHGLVERDTPWLTLLREANAEGSQQRLVSVISEFLADVAKAKLPECCDQNRYVFQVVFLASEAPDAPLVRILVHKDGLARTTLPGIRGPQQPLYEVFAAEDLSVRLDSVYQSEPVENPLTAQSGEFVRLVFGKLALPLGTNVVVGLADAAFKALTQVKQDLLIGTKPPLAITLSRIELPEKRAKITINHTLSVGDPLLHARAQAALVADSIRRDAIINKALERTSAMDPSCENVADAIQATIGKETGSASCSPLAPDPAECFKVARTAIGVTYQAAAKQNLMCRADTAFPLARRFVSLFPEKFTLPIKGGTTLVNTPETHWTFGLSTAFIGGIKTDNDNPRAKISNGKIVVDPFSRVLAMGIVNWTPAGYDPGSVLMTKKERFKIFGGVAFAPHFGGTGGVSWAFNRYLGANIGYAYLVYDTPKDGEQLDTEPTAPNKAAPFDLAGTHAWFVGLTYTVGK
jgi:hypothetical protein